MRSVCWGGEKILAGTNGGEIFEITAADKEKPVTLVQVNFFQLALGWVGLGWAGGDLVIAENNLRQYAKMAGKEGFAGSHRKNYPLFAEVQSRELIVNINLR